MKRGGVHSEENEEKCDRCSSFLTPCVVMSVNCSVNDISNVRCHGWDMGVKEMKDNNTVQRDERSLEHRFEKS